MEELKVGDVIKERYALVRFLGSGSFGEVWLAHDQLTGRDMALKIYLSLDPAGIEEFQMEYSNTIDLSSKYLLTPGYLDVYGRRPYLVMRYCENGSSSKLAGNITEEQLWQFVHDVAEGLAVLHGQSDPIVHQDIKPDNILVDKNGHFLITDFGISRRLRATMRRQSKRDVNSGAMPYMAPERFESNPRLSTASDIWSLGASIYELATGELPFNGFGGAMQRTGAEMPSLPQNFSPVLCEIMQRCLSTDAENRPSAVEVLKWAKSKTISKTPLVARKNISAEQPVAVQGPKTKNNSVKSSSHFSTSAFWIVLAILSVVITVWETFDSGNTAVDASQSNTAVESTSQDIDDDSWEKQFAMLMSIRAEEQILNSSYVTVDGQVVHFYRGAFYYKNDIYPIMVAFIVADDDIKKVIYKNITYGGQIVMSCHSQGNEILLSGKDGNYDFTMLLSAGKDNDLLGTAVDGEKKMEVKLMPSTESFEIKGMTKFTSFKIGSGSISVPDFLKYDGESDDGGPIFVDGHVRLFVNYADNQDLELYHEWTTNEIGNGTPVYDLIKDNYFVQSGYNHDGEIYYAKAYMDVSCNPHILYYATIIYPVKEKERIDKIISKIFKEFPNLDC